MRKNNVKKKPGFARNSGFCFWSACRFALGVLVLTPDFDGDGQVTFADFLTFAGKFGSRLGQERYDPRCDLSGFFTHFERLSSAVT